MDEEIEELQKEVLLVLDNIVPGGRSVIEHEVHRVFKACSQDYLLHEGLFKLAAQFCVKARCPERSGTGFYSTRNVVLECLCEVFPNGPKVSSMDSARWRSLAECISARINT
jgi:hypothetical protein